MTMGSVGKKEASVLMAAELGRKRKEERREREGKRERWVLSLVGLLVNPETIVVVTTGMCNCHLVGRETWDAAKHPLTHRTQDPTKNYLAPNVEKAGRLKGPGEDRQWKPCWHHVLRQ